MSATEATFIWRAATAERWPDVEEIFEDCGDGRKCWCAYWYLPNKDFKSGWGEGNRTFFRELVTSGAEPGIVGYLDGEAAGWVSVAPRQAFDRLNRSKPFAAVDDLPVWAVNCFIVRKKFRRRGLMRHLIGGAIEFVRDRQGRHLEAYPYDSSRKPSPGYDLFVGTAAAFRECGFREVERRLPARPIMRLTIPKKKARPKPR